MIKTVIREHHWQPSEIKKLYLDSDDFLGLEYWYNDVMKVIAEMKKK